MDKHFYLRLLMIFTYAFIIGVVIGVFYPVLPAYQVYFWSVTVVLALLVGGQLWLLHNQPEQGKLLFYLLLILVAFLAGWGRYSLSLGHLYPNHVSEYLSTSFQDQRVMEGEVVEAPSIYEDQVRIRISPTRIWPSGSQQEGESKKVAGGDIQVQIKPYHEVGVDYDYLANNEVYGDKLRIKGSIMPPPGRSNPYGFSYKNYLHNHGLYGNVFWAEKIEIVEKGSGNPLVSWSLALQTKMLKVIKLTMPYPQSAFLGGATLGLRHGLEYSTCAFEGCDRLITQEFRGAGTMHVLAVSGLHVGVIAVAFWALFAGLRIPEKLYVPMIIICLIIFTIITGARPATVRAAIMTSLMLLVFAYLKEGLRNSVLFGVSAAALLILLYHPRYVFEASFTLSFAAVLCLALISGPADQIIQKLSGLSFIFFWIAAVMTTVSLIFYWNFMLTWYVYLPYIAFWAGAFWYARRIDSQYIIAGGIGFLDIPAPMRNFIGMQFAIQLGMMWPLSAYYFKEYPFAGIYANLVAIPLVSVVVPLGLFAGLLGLIPAVGPWVALVLNAGNYLAVTLFLWVSHIAMDIFPYPAVRKFTIWHLLIFYTVLAIFVWWDRVYSILKQVWFWLSERLFDIPPVSPRAAVAYFLGGIAVLVFASTFFLNAPPKKLKVTVLNVGYGSAIAVQTPGGSNLLINGAGRKWDWHNKEGRADRRDEGRRTVAPFFLSQGVKSLDLLALQSVEPQRSGGLTYITRNFVVDRAVGPLAEEAITPLNKNRFVSALQDPGLSRDSNREWFKKDYYGNWKRWWSQLQAKDIPYEAPRQGEMIYSETNSTSRGPVELKIYCLNPPENHRFSRHGAKNSSLVFRLEYGDVSFLLPGDIRFEGQQQVMGLKREFVNSDVMLVPGNGVWESSYNESFLKRVKPNYVVLSSSDRIPLQRTDWGSYVSDLESQVKKTWKQYSSKMSRKRLFYTQKDKAVIFETDGKKLKANTFAGEQSKESKTAGQGDVSKTGW